MAPDVVLISHLHLDHLHLPSLARVVGRGDRPTRLLVPRGAAPVVRRLGSAVDVVEVQPGDHVDVGSSVTVSVTPARHSCRRGPHSRVVADPVGYVVRGRGQSAYFAGDTDLFPEMRELGPIDLALLPIWGWGPTLGEGHLDPARAAQAVALIDPAVVVPIHWGTYSPVRAGRGAPDWIDAPLAKFESALTEIGLVDRLHALPPGASLERSRPSRGWVR